jgi:hypothetical protein
MEKIVEVLCLVCTFDERILTMFDGNDMDAALNTRATTLKVFEDNSSFWQDYTESGHDVQSLSTQIDRLSMTQKKNS